MFVWLVGICKSQMATFKYVINKIDMNHAGQCYLIRNREERELEISWPAGFHRTLHKCEVELSLKQVKVNNMKIIDTDMIFVRAMALQCSQPNYYTETDGT